MGNCQAADAATIVIQHPDGKVEKVYWSLKASQVMANNPGHYVAIIITTPTNVNTSRPSSRSGTQAAVKHLKLLRPDDSLHIGHVYRLVSFEEVLREFVSKKHVKLSRLVLKQHKEKHKANNRKPISSSCSFVDSSSVSSPVPLRDAGGFLSRVDQPSPTTSNEQRQEVEDEKKLDDELDEVVQRMMIGFRNTRSRAFGGGSATTLARHGQWRPVLQSISEVGS